MPKRAEQVAALVLTVLAAILHVLRLRYAGALWRDEAGAAQLAALPTFREIYESFPHEAFPPLFPGTLRAYMALFGDSDLAFRVFGLVVGLAILAALWWNARRAGALPLVSILLVQFHPAFPLYGDSVRGYGLGTLLILLTFGAFARMVDRPDRTSILLALLAATASVHLLLHNAALLAGICASAAVVGLLRRRYRVMLAAAGVGLAAALTLLPYAGPLRSASDWRVLLVEEITAGEILAKIARVIGTPFPWMVWVWCGAALLAVAAVFVRGRVRPDPADQTENDHSADTRLFRLLVVPAALAGEVAFLMAVGYSPRIWYVLPVLALMASALDGLLAANGNAPVRMVRVAAAALLAMAIYSTALHTARMRMTNVDMVAQAIEQSAGPRDLVLVNQWYMGISFHRYYRGKARWMTIPRIDDHRMHRFDLLKEKMRSTDPLLDVRRAMRRTLSRGGRIWVVGHLSAQPTGRTSWPPPAPKGPWGWRDGPYSSAWTQQVSMFLEESTGRRKRIFVPAGGRVSGMEDLRIWMYSGERDPEEARARKKARPSQRTSAPSRGPRPKHRKDGPAPRDLSSVLRDDEPESRAYSRAPGTMIYRPPVLGAIPA